MSDPSRFLTVSNLLSILRALLIAPFACVALSDIPGARLWACLIIALAALTDRLDGLLARKMHTVTEWGKILDPLADKLAVAAGRSCFSKLGAIPLWFVICLIARDILIFCGGLFLRRRGDPPGIQSGGKMGGRRDRADAIPRARRGRSADHRPLRLVKRGDAPPFAVHCT